MLIGDVAKAAQCKRPTLDRYVRAGLIPCSEDGESGYRIFTEEAITRVAMIKTLTKRPFRLDLEEIKDVFKKVPLSDLNAKRNTSVKALQRYLLDKDLL